MCIQCECARDCSTAKRTSAGKPRWYGAQGAEVRKARPDGRAQILNKIYLRLILYDMVELSSKQRKLLEKAAQPMSAMVQVGGAGMTEQQVAQIDRCLADHELIKVKFNEFKEDKKELTAEVVQKTDATLVRIIGNVAVLYRPAEKAEDRQYEKALKKA